MSSGIDVEIENLTLDRIATGTQRGRRGTEIRWGKRASSGDLGPWECVPRGGRYMRRPEGVCNGTRSCSRWVRRLPMNLRAIDVAQAYDLCTRKDGRVSLRDVVSASRRDGKKDRPDDCSNAMTRPEHARIMPAPARYATGPRRTECAVAPTSTVGVFGACVLLGKARRWRARDRQIWRGPRRRKDVCL